MEARPWGGDLLKTTERKNHRARRRMDFAFPEKKDELEMAGQLDWGMRRNPPKEEMQLASGGLRVFFCVLVGQGQHLKRNQVVSGRDLTLRRQARAHAPQRSRASITSTGGVSPVPMRKEGHGSKPCLTAHSYLRRCSGTRIGKLDQRGLGRMKEN